MGFKISELGDRIDFRFTGFIEDYDNLELLMCTGVHGVCGGFIEVIDISKYKVLLCRKCHLRVSFPKEIETYGKFREHFKNKY